jgi:hypothetical protein
MYYIFFGILLWVLYVLLPIIPAFIIYKNFPDTYVGTQGLLGNLKINSTGAFAAYIVTTVLGFFVVEFNQELISKYAREKTSWQVSSKIKFLERNADGSWIESSGLSDEDVEAKLDIRTHPNYTVKSLNHVDFITHSIHGLPKVTFSYPAYDSFTIDLQDPDISIDELEKKINLGQIELRRANQEYNPEIFEGENSFRELNR